MTMSPFRKKSTQGFTLIELLVVIAIIGILSSVVLSSLNSARAKARDTKRKQDTVQVRIALELYFDDNRRYPLAYPGAWSGVSTVPCGPANAGTSGSDPYIAGLTPTYMPTLPVDPGTPGICNGYLYNSDGSNYKFLVHASAESYPTAGQPFYDPVRPTWAWMICSGEPACSSW